LGQGAQGGHRVRGQRVELGVGLGDLGVEGVDASGQPAQRQFGCLEGLLEPGRVGPVGGGPGESGAGGEPDQLVVDGGGGGGDQVPQLVEGPGPVPDRAVAGHLDGAEGFHDPGAQLGTPDRGTGQHLSGRGLGVDRVGLALPGPGGLLRAVHLDHVDPGDQQMPGQPGAIRAGRLHPDRTDQPMTGDPVQQLLVARPGGRELPHAQQPAGQVKDGREMDTLVGVHPGNHDSGAVLGAGVGL
jgi:hypothetical protein